jgi:2-polyprenyl-6-methoxyphenol hydroxylase-like FAD-dependent oxidoreductase
MLARLLFLKDIPVTVFESETSPDYRSQGGTLDLHSSSGMTAMKEAELWEEFEKNARYDGQYLAMTNRDLRYLFVRGAADNIRKVMDERPEIDRAKLRQILTESLPEGIIKWGHRLLNVEANGTLVFQNTTESDFSLVVGAEGAWSKVRKFLAPNLRPVYAGVGMHDLQIPDAQRTAPEIYKLVNRGSVFAGSEGQRLTSQQLGSGAINVYAFQRYENADWMKPSSCGYDTTNLNGAKPALLKDFAHWCPELRAILHATAGSCIARSLYILPTGQRWTHRPGFTLIGDAAHLMTPFAGEGVNQALKDALSLSHVIIAAASGDKNFDAEIALFEDEMIGRTTKLQQLSFDLLQDWMFTSGAPESIMPKMLARHVNARLPWLAHPLTLAGLYIYYYVTSWF